MGSTVRDRPTTRSNFSLKTSSCPDDHFLLKTILIDQLGKTIDKIRTFFQMINERLGHIQMIIWGSGHGCGKAQMII